MVYEKENEAKANFDDVYMAPTPHAYIATMAKTGYEIGEKARPYCTAAAELLQECNGDVWPVQMLDVGCSYGMGSAFVKYGCSFDEMVAFFASRVPEEYVLACEVVRSWLNVTAPACDVRTVGLDSSEPALQFAVDAGMLDGSIAKNFEDSETTPSDDDIGWFRSCNLMIATGAIGYGTEKSLDVILRHLGQAHPADTGPFVVLTILRMFNVEPIHRVFETHGMEFGPAAGIRLPQRRFEDDREQEEVLRILHGKGLDTQEWEDEGRHYADLYIAAPTAEQFADLLERMRHVQGQCEEQAEPAGYIQR